MVICPNCNTKNTDESLFCGNCGTKLEHKIVCPQCGGEVPKDMKFCFHCGFSLQEKSALGGVKENVFGGDIDGSFNTTYVSNVHNESSDVVECEVCGKLLAKGSGEVYKCRKCGRLCCSKHFDEEYNLCSLCAEEIKEAEAERKRKEEEAERARKEAEERAAKEKARIEEEKRAEAERKRKAEEAERKRIEEAKRAEAERKRAEAKLAEEKKLAEAKKREEAEKAKIEAERAELEAKKKAFDKLFASAPGASECKLAITKFLDKKAKAVVIPENVDTIGDEAFAECKAIESVEIPECVTHIG